jgi:hypothetical protein
VAGVDQRRPGRAAVVADAGAALEEKGEQRLEHARVHGMDAGGREVQRGVALAIHLRGGVHVGAGVQQRRGDGHDVLRRALAEALDAVRADVVQQRGVMTARRSRPHQHRILAQQPGQRLEIAADDGVGGGFEPGHR